MRGSAALPTGGPELRAGWRHAPARPHAGPALTHRGLAVAPVVDPGPQPRAPAAARYTGRSASCNDAAPAAPAPQGDRAPAEPGPLRDGPLLRAAPSRPRGRVVGGGRRRG